ncbi:hypothetical protein [Burkholderia sp. A2]|uniref:hypothetical protein n=1 Tax=Burkholderia sp. A2 TaxID=236253 RepID=UPI00114CEE1C|nr:hypothetical protein [Burkholderia sp. A2]
MRKITKIATATIFLTIFKNSVFAQNILPPININASSWKGMPSDFMGDIGPPSNGPSVFAQAYIPFGPKMKCDFTRSLKMDLMNVKSCDLNNPPDIGRFSIEQQLARNQPIRAGVRLVWPNYAKLQNGCGPANGWIRHIIPNSIGGFDFTGACNAHDVCYGSGIRKGECDDKFDSDMRGICGGNGFCNSAADIYSKAVRDHGQSAWEEAQDQYKCAMYGAMRGHISQFLQYNWCQL